MADFDNLAEINENFDTIKTLLNSIRAQGILNTSDVDKLLSGINMKLEKINTEEDIDLIKIFLSELKQNLDERHNLLISKFGAIESLFANLLKNSSEMLKSSEVKELFDIVATNLSVFSREVVSQKESLTDISLRIDAIRSDDSQKKDIIKNIALLKSDIERLSNGFDSIVISLNDNFKTVVKSITALDKSEHFEKFSNTLTSIEISSNTVLSALQMIDKKAEQVEQALKDVATKDDISGAAQKIFELSAQSQELTTVVSDLNTKYAKFDTLNDKIDASVNVIAGLKSVLEDTDNVHTQKILAELSALQEKLLNVSSEEKFEELKNELGTVFKFIQERLESLGDRSVLVFEEIQKLAAFIQALDIQQSLDSLQNELKSSSEDITLEFGKGIQSLSTLNEVGVTRVINEISENAKSLSTKLNQTQAEINIICEKNFSSVFERVSDVKTLIAQIDENSISANNAIFSSITDRLSLFENSLRDSLDLQEKTVLNSSAQLVEHIENIKNVSNVLDYKLDTSVVEAANVKREFADLKTSVEQVLALDFTNVVKDLRIDLYAIKQELSNSFENSSSELTERFTSDLYGKYELLVSKIDSTEEELRKTQTSALSSLKAVLENISSSLLDILSYVSEVKTSATDTDNVKFDEIINLINDNNINYIESVRDIVDIIRVQVESNIKSIEEETLNNFDNIKKVISENSEDLKKEIKYSYSKLLEIQDSYNEVQEILNITKADDANKFAEVLSSTNILKTELEIKLDTLKNTLLNNISDFKTEFTCENADKISEIKFSVDSLYTKNSQELQALITEMRDSISQLSADQIDGRSSALAKLSDEFSLLKDLLYTLQDKNSGVLNEKTESVLNDLNLLKAQISENKNKSSELLNTKIQEVLGEIEATKEIVNKLDENVDGDMSRQLSIIEGNFESLVSQLTILFDKSEITMSDKLETEFAKISEIMQESVDNKLNSYKEKIETVFDELKGKTIEQSEYLQERISALHETLKEIWSEQSQDNAKQLEELTLGLKALLDDNIDISESKLNDIKINLEQFLISLDTQNKELVKGLNSQLDDIAQYINTILDTQAQENEERQSELETFLSNVTSAVQNNKDALNILNTELTNNIETLSKNLASVSLNVTDNKNSLAVLNSDLTGLIANTTAEINENNTLVTNLSADFTEKITELKDFAVNSAKEELLVIDTYVNNITQQIELQKTNIISCKDIILKALKSELSIISTNVEKETDIIIAEIIEQFDLMKKAQNDEFVGLATNIEDVVNTAIYNNIEDLKSYLDIKTDNTILNTKFDNLKIEMTSGVDSVIEGMSKLLESSVFVSSMSDFKLANEILVNNAFDALNSKFEDFINNNITEISSIIESKNSEISEKLSLFDKKFIDLLIEKFEEIKLTTNSYNTSFEKIQTSISEVLSEFDYVKQTINNEVNSLSQLIKNSVTATNSAISKLNESFSDLKQEILNKTSDETLKQNINEQISGIENLVNDQLGYLESIEDLCASNLPELAEIGTLVKHSILTSLNDLNERIDNINVCGQFENELKQLQSDIITQFLNIFNQISFVVEQEEIIDFIQEKHDELITILSHIVTTNDGIEDIKDNVAIVDNKINTLKEDIDLINEKITAIISSDGDIDYVYSLQDLEADIANLRLVLNEMKNSGNNFDDLIASTEDIYKLVETIKEELPSKQDFEGMAEDLVSISTRTNKLILASDESYKNLQDNLQDFKLVINDLDERTRNFAQEAGLDRIDNKLNSLNNMMQSGAKTNQVFNQVFEYLAEWVDNASVQINSISNKIETLDDIEQIKAMLLDIKEGAEDNSETVELIEALGNVFDKQTKRISALETKLDKIIVETTINNKNNKLDLTPFETTLNSFLVAIDEKMSTQQDKINSLELKLETIMNSFGEKNTQQLTKKVGGMDKQIAKLNKSIEKIASYVVEK